MANHNAVVMGIKGIVRNGNGVQEKKILIFPFFFNVSARGTRQKNGVENHVCSA